MAYSRRGLPAVVVGAFVIVAILGYMAGHGGRSAPTSEKTRVVGTASVLFEAPAVWQPTAAAPEIPGLTFSDVLALAPNGNAAHAGLVAGRLAGAEASPLSTRFVARLPTVPNTEVVDLSETQAYRYSRLSVPGFDRMLVLYAIPNPNGSPTAVACYASPAFSAYVRTCEHIVATLTLVGRSPENELAPDPGFARHVSAVIGVLDRQRVALRAEMGRHATLATVHAPSARLADAFATAAASLSLLVPPPAAAQARTMLSDSISRARDAYVALGAAAAAQHLSDYEAAQRRVYEAEASVRDALANLATLGYE
jgi:hypothetical protein